MSGQVWEHVRNQLPKLVCTSAKTTLGNGGDPISTDFRMKNRAGLEQVWLIDPSSRQGGLANNVFACGDGVSELRIGTGRGCGRGLHIYIQTCGGNKDGSDHLRLIGQLFDNSAYWRTEQSLIADRITKSTEQLRIARYTLTRVEAA